MAQKIANHAITIGTGKMDARGRRVVKRVKAGELVELTEAEIEAITAKAPEALREPVDEKKTPPAEVKKATARRVAGKTGSVLRTPSTDADDI